MRTRCPKWKRAVLAVVVAAADSAVEEVAVAAVSAVEVAAVAVDSAAEAAAVDEVSDYSSQPTSKYKLNFCCV